MGWKDGETHEPTELLELVYRDNSRPGAKNGRDSDPNRSASTSLTGGNPRSYEEFTVRNPQRRQTSYRAKLLFFAYCMGGYSAKPIHRRSHREPSGRLHESRIYRFFLKIDTKRHWLPRVYSKCLLPSDSVYNHSLAPVIEGVVLFAKSNGATPVHLFSPTIYVLLIQQIYRACDLSESDG